MNILVSLSFLSFLIFGIYLFYLSFRNSKNYFTGEETEIRKIISRSALISFSATIIFFSSVYFIGSLTEISYKWSFLELVKSFGLFSIPGFVIFAGSLWQFFFVSKYRDILLKIINKRNIKY